MSKSPTLAPRRQPPEALLVAQAVVVLPVDVLQSRLPQPDLAALGIEAVLRAQVVETVGERPAAPIHREVLVVAGVALAERTHLPAVQGQAGDFPGGQHAALEGLWQQAAVVAQEDWQFRQQFAELQLGIRQLQLRRHAQSRVVVAARPSAWRGSSPEPARSGLLSSFRPSWPISSTPRPRVPWV